MSRRNISKKRFPETDSIYNVYLKRQKEDIKMYKQENKTKIPLDFDFNEIKHFMRDDRNGNY